MKVKELFEQYNKVDVAFEYELELVYPNGDVAYKNVNVTGEVIITKDAYGTGDSPTDYEFEVEHLIDQDNGRPLTDDELTRISKSDWDHIETTAVEKVQRHM